VHGIAIAIDHAEQKEETDGAKAQGDERNFSQPRIGIGMVQGAEVVAQRVHADPWEDGITYGVDVRAIMEVAWFVEEVPEEGGETFPRDMDVVQEIVTSDEQQGQEKDELFM